MFPLDNSLNKEHKYGWGRHATMATVTKQQLFFLIAPFVTLQLAIIFLWLLVGLFVPVNNYRSYIMYGDIGFGALFGAYWIFLYGFIYYQVRRP
jgi:hypothetical protein